MNKNTYNLLMEPSGPSYNDLLDYALGDCKYFLLVTSQNNSQLNSRGKEILEELVPYLFRKEMKSEWPGTILLGGEAPVFIYHYIPETVAILKMSATRLYQWQRPDLPDDLCLLRSDESPWLVTIAHENDSYLELTENEMLQLIKEIPSFNTLLEIANE
jgi:hypothetical protein